MKKLILALLLAAGCATSGVAKPDSPLLTMGEARCIPGPDEMPNTEVCAQILTVKEGCTVLQSMPATDHDKPVYVVGLLCGAGVK